MNDLKLIDDLMEKDFINHVACAVNSEEITFHLAKEVNGNNMQYLIDKIETEFYIKDKILVVKRSPKDDGTF